MPKQKNIKILIRFGNKDNDILHLIQRFKPKNLIIWSTEYYLGLRTEKIPVEPNVKELLSPKVCEVTLCYETEKEVYNLFKTIPASNRGAAIRLMLRNAMAGCDISFLINAEQAEQEAYTKTEKTSNSNNKEKRENKMIDEIQKEQEPKVENKINNEPKVESSNIFDLI
jgi:hypothetical protein